MPADSSEHVVMTAGELAEVVQKNAVATAEGDEPVITEVFITDDSQIFTEKELLGTILRHSMRGIPAEKIHREAENSKEDVAKGAVSGSTQSDNEINRIEGLSNYKVVEPPYPPEVLATFMEIDEYHWRCCKTKMTDAIGKDYSLEPASGTDNSPYDPADASAEDKKLIKEEIKVIRNFIEDCNDVTGFDGVLERAGLDYEGIGWAAIEVIRSRDKKIRKIAHIPASRVKVLRGFVGFVEIIDTQKQVYYQPFGAKVVSKTRQDPVSGKYERYNPREDKDLTTDSEWNFIDRETGDPTADFTKAANELLWIPKHHSNTIYYGMSDAIPAMGYIIENVHIRDYMLQFFEHNTIPRYAIIIEGAKLSPEVTKSIQEYFSTHVKGKAHKTLIIPVPAMKSEVKIRFEKLSADKQEGSFQDQKKNNGQGTMTAHGVSSAIIGITDTASLGSGKGMSQGEMYKDRIVKPSQKRWATQLNKLFRLGLGVKMIGVKFTPFDIRDLEVEMKTQIGYLERGCTTINRIVQRTGLGDPIEGGDRAFILMNQGSIMFVDELTQAAGTERQQLEDQVDSMKQEMQLRAKVQQQQNMNGRAAASKAKPTTPPAQKAGKSGGKGGAGGKPTSSK